MKRFLILLVAAALLRLEHTAVDITVLEPVELLAVTVEDGLLHIRTDTGSFGQGTDLDSALADLRRRADAQVFPDTADYLVVNAEAVRLLPELARVLRPACRVWRTEEDPDPENMAAWLKLHPPGERLLDHIS